jgi:cell division protein FtsA
MIRHKTITAIDIGTANIVAAFAKIDRKAKILSLEISACKNNGFDRGMITDLDRLTDSIQSVARSLSLQSKTKIRDVFINISGTCITARHSHTAIPLGDRVNRVIGPSDIQKINNQARLLGLKLEEELIHQIPQSYTLDDYSKAVNPLGLHARKLEVDLYLLVTRIDHVNNLVKAVNQAGLEVIDIELSGLADSMAVLEPGEKQEGCILINIGAGLTEILVFKDGILRHIDILALGGNDITEMIAARFKLPFELAEEMKKSYGFACSQDVDTDREVLIKQSSSYKPIRQRLICEAIELKIGELISAIKDKIDKSGFVGRLNSGIVITGGTVLLPGLLERIESELGLSVRLGRIKNVNFAHSKMPLYSTVVGLVRYGIETSLSTHSRLAASRNFVSGFLGRVKQIYQEYF